MDTPRPFDHNVCETISVITNGFHVQGISIFPVDEICCIFSGLLNKDMGSVNCSYALWKAMSIIKKANCLFHFLF